MALLIVPFGAVRKDSWELWAQDCGSRSDAGGVVLRGVLWQGVSCLHLGQWQNTHLED